ncbi:hypothetical protein ZOD2009_09218 [Haladaptatus paucihalophilus DX253]|uniref:CHAT domain-containing protein n=1 Tax=Haladaptatus paucihalophilus DX253 TaxID=797209 RepID=E7QSR8_HALPU|nr:hypothetical protein ZOD2009_09218 [Haladaptatus paucihalophilus DX253]SHK07297.1 hypothetical protein SAMN05444342_0481 [Haladaptatus paucihalophilus DX253]
MKPIFRRSSDFPGVTVVDPIHRRQFPIRTSATVAPRPTDTDQFHFPVDSAVEVTTDSLMLPYVVITHVRSIDGAFLREAEDFSYEQFPDGEYLVELNAPIRIYLRVSGEMTLASSAEHMAFDFGTETRVRIGARSYHEQPEATVTTTTDPRDVMTAVSTFGSALKTLSCERSLPSLRGHPPRIELGDELHVPDELSPPETGVRIELPPELPMIYSASTLAYYLGATVVPGDEPRLVTDRGFVHPLDHHERGYEGEIERVLAQSLFFDCVTRTEGLYRIPLHERRVIEPLLDLSFDELYELDLAEQLETYLDIPFDVVREHVPTWLLSTTVTDDIANVRSIPYLVNNLSFISSPREDERHEPAPEIPDPIDSFLRGGGSRREDRPADPGRYVAPTSTNSLERAWLGEGMPIGANKLIERAFENRLERSSSTDGIDITVVCNEPEMSAEYDAGDALYGKRDELAFDIDVHRNLSVDELASVLATPTDFLHYIGHVEDGHFICRDGKLDVGSVDGVAVDTFLLNGCRSYEQGLELIDSGSIGGVVTYSEITNKSAIAVGRTIARLLNRGFSLRSALTIVRDQRMVGNQYIVVGDGSIEIAQSESGTPFVCHLDADGNDGRYELRILTYPTVESGMGALFTPFINDIDTYFLSGGEVSTFSVDKETLVQFLRLEQIPVIVDGDITWSTELNLGLL